MTVAPFPPNAPVLLFDCTIEFHTKLTLIMALDTGSSYTVIREAAARKIGFELDKVQEWVTIGDASQHHIAHKVTLKSFSLADAKIDSLDVLIYTLPEEHGIDGIIGLNFLRQFNIGLDFKQGILTLNR